MPTTGETRLLCGQDTCPFAERIGWLESASRELAANQKALSSAVSDLATNQQALNGQLQKLFDFVKAIAQRDKECSTDARAAREASERAADASERAASAAREAANHAAELNERTRPKPNPSSPDLQTFDDDWENISTEVLDRLPSSQIASQIRRMDSDLRGLRGVEEERLRAIQEREDALRAREAAEEARLRVREERDQIARDKAAADQKARYRLIYAVVLTVLTILAALKELAPMVRGIFG